MVGALEDLARDAGFQRLWVAATDDDVAFYRQCSYRGDERFDVPARDHSRRVVTVLTKALVCELSTTG
jgi:hypothetical protein